MKRLSLHSRTGINNREFKMYDATVAKTSLKIAISSLFSTFFGIISVCVTFESSQDYSGTELRRIYTTIILGTALLNFGTRANSFGHGPLDLHGKIRSCFFNVDFWNGTPETRTALYEFLRLFDSVSQMISGALPVRFRELFNGRLTSTKGNCLACCFEKAKTSVTI